MKSLSQAIRSETAVIKTGQVNSFDVYTATVSIDGVLITLKLMDHVTVSLNRVVVCIVQGDTGFVIGTLDTTTRTPQAANESATPTSSKLVPTVTYGTNTYTPKSVGNWKSGTSTGWTSLDGRVWQTYGVDRYQGCWFYGKGRFKSLQGKTITKVQIYVRFIVGTTATLQYHIHPSVPAGAPTTGGTPQTVTGGGWVTLPNSWADVLKSGDGSGGIIAVGTPLAKMKGLPDGGTLKISWKK